MVRGCRITVLGQMPAPLFGNFKQGDQAFILDLCSKRNAVRVAVYPAVVSFVEAARCLLLLQATPCSIRLAARLIISRVTPVIIMLTPTSVPITHNEFEGHCLQTSTPRIRVTIPSNKIQADPWALASMVSILQLLWHVFAHQDPRVPRGCGALGIVSAAAHQSDSSLGNYNPPLRV